MFWTGRVMDILFDGILIDCSNTEDFATQAVCSIFASGEVQAVKPFNDTHYSFSLFQGVRIFGCSRKFGKNVQNFISFSDCRQTEPILVK